MIGQYLPQTNENTTIAKFKNFSHLNEALVLGKKIKILFFTSSTFRKILFSSLVHKPGFYHSQLLKTIYFIFHLRRFL